MEQFMAVTGASAEEATMFMEMSGGDVETAIAIFFDNMGGAGAAPAAAGGDTADVPADVGAGAEAGLAPVPEWWRIIWPASAEPPEAWTKQCLDRDASWKCGIPQPKNGPCGVLAVVHSLVLAEQCALDLKDINVSPEAVAKAIDGILSRCKPEAGMPVRLVRPKQKGNYKPDAELEVAEYPDASAATQEISARVQDFIGPGGIIDLVYSAVFTRGDQLVKKEVEAETKLPLVDDYRGSWICTTDLLSLLLRGCARGNVGTTNGDASQNSSWDGACPVGMLSTESQGIPLAAALKNPKCPVWIIHGGDHFTVAWAKAMPSSDAGAEFTMHHWNGLPPAGPRVATLEIKAVRGAVVGAEKIATEYRLEPGEIEEVVQADQADTKEFKDQYRRWRYEVMLALDQPDVQLEVRPADMAAEPRFEQEDPRYQRDGAWRCRICYANRFATFNFELVPADSPDCHKCKKARKECGWSLWMPFEDLPPKIQERVMKDKAKNIEKVLWTKWPAAVVAVAGGGDLPSC